MDLPSLMPEDWREVLRDEFDAPYFAKLQAFVSDEYATHTCYPPADLIFNAMRHTPFDDVRVLLLGQDPYHGPGQAHGLAFSVQPGVKPPPSLRNIFKELRDDQGCEPPNHGSLTAWADRGVLLLNAVLTVRAGEAASHARHGWEQFTDAAIRKLSERDRPLVFLLWGGYAKKKTKLVDTNRHAVVESGHPSPLSQRHFLGKRPFGAVNEALQELGQPPLDWCLPNR